MPEVKVNLPGFGEIPGMSPIVILGPNCSGKTKIAQEICKHNLASPISAQRRLWINESIPIPMYSDEDIVRMIHESENRWKKTSGLPTEEMKVELSGLVREHVKALAKKK